MSIFDEFLSSPAVLGAFTGAAQAMARMVPGLQVDTGRMRANIDTLAAQLPAEAIDEWFNVQLAEQVALRVPPRLAQLRASLQTSQEAP